MEPSSLEVSWPIATAGVVGAGQMGAGIAGTMARAGIATVLVDVDRDRLDAAVARAHRIAGHEAPLSVSVDLSAIGQTNLVIEAITEDEAAKTALFQKLSHILQPAASVASNTSTIPISRMAWAVEHPSRFAGMHFFHPVHRMELVEVIRGVQSSDETILRLTELARRLGKSPTVVGDGPGFFTTRVLCAYLCQALELVGEGVAMHDVDEAATQFGMPRGPIALLDLVGLDTALAIARVMAAAFPVRFRIHPLLEERVASGNLGWKTGEGFRPHREGLSSSFHARGVAGGGHVSTRPEIADRLFLPMLLEAVRTLEESIVASPQDVDTGSVLGLGFPVARGGLWTWLQQEGAAAILARLKPLRHLGPAFEPPALLNRLASDPHATTDDAAGRP